MQVDSIDDSDCFPTDARKRGLDRRRETSRYAARDRRGKEADIFTDLKEVVPLVEDSAVTHVDRIALLRVAATLCRMRQNAEKFLQQCQGDDAANEAELWSEMTLSECFDGFVLMADSSGMILYVTESIQIFLGLTQTDFIGCHLKDFIQQSDYDELFNRVIIGSGMSNGDCQQNDSQSIVLRMKTVISPRGRTLNFKSALYKAIICRCRFVPNAGSGGSITLIQGCSSPAGQGNQPSSLSGSPLVAKGCNEAGMGVYTTRHTCDLKFTYVSDSLNYLLCQQSNKTLVGSSFYELVHPADLSSLVTSVKELFRKGHCRTDFYRLLGANGAVVWAQTEATTVSHTTKGQRGQYVLAVHSILGMQSQMDCWQSSEAIEIPAAHPAYRNIKSEIVDVAEYFGRQPEFVDCVDFTPLIEPMPVAAAMNLQQPNISQPRRIQRANYQDDTDIMVLGQAQSGIEPISPAGPDDSCTGLNDEAQPRTRKSSYEEVLQWLFCDDELQNLPQSFNLGTEQCTNGGQGNAPQPYAGNRPLQPAFRAPSTPQYPRQQQPGGRAHSSGVARGGGPGRAAPVQRAPAAAPQPNFVAQQRHPSPAVGRGVGGKWVSCSPSGRSAQPVVSRGKSDHLYEQAQQPRYSRYEQHCREQQQAGGKLYSQIRARSEQQHIPAPVPAIPVQQSIHSLPVNPGPPTNLQRSVPIAYRPVPSKFVPAKGQRSSSSSSGSSFQPQSSGQPPAVAIVQPFNVNHLPTVDPSALMPQPTNSPYIPNCAPVNISDDCCQPKISNKQQPYAPPYGSMDYMSCPDQEDLCASYKECEQLGAQLAPFLPREDMFELCEDIAPLNDFDIEGLFPEFDMAEMLAKQPAPQTITKELGNFGESPMNYAKVNTSASGIPSKRARFENGGGAVFGLEFGDDPFLAAS